jgi:multiple sugar transport system permease protein
VATASHRLNVRRRGGESARLPDGRWRLYGYLLPAAILLVAVFAVPIVQTVWLSLHTQEGLSPVKTWSGLANYRHLFDDGIFWRIFLQTIVWTVSVVGLTTIIGFAVAHVLRAGFRGRWLFRVVLMLPWATSLALSAVVWRFAMSPRGLVNESISLLGLGEVSVAWLANVPQAAFAVIFVGIWVSVPFTAVMLAAAMRSIPGELYEAAELDGSRALATSLHITLPMIRRVLLMVTLSNFVVVFNSFPIIYVMTGGGPVNKTDILATYLYRTGFSGDFDIGTASAVAVVILVLLLILSVFYVRGLVNRTRVA